MLRHSDERRRLSAIVHELGNDDVTRLSRAAFTVAVRRHFSPDVHLRDIADLTAAARDSFYPELNLMTTEFMVRAALGEQVPEPGLSVWDEIAAKTLVLALFADWWQRDESAVNATLIQAEAELFEAGGSLAPAES